MSLLEAYMEDFCIVEKTRATDGAGGYKYTWEEGDTFSAACLPESSSITTIANQEKLTVSYKVTKSRDVSLPFDTKIKRVSDDQYFRITSDDDTRTPYITSLDMSQVTAEKWSPQDD